MDKKLENEIDVLILKKLEFYVGYLHDEVLLSVPDVELVDPENEDSDLVDRKLIREDLETIFDELHMCIRSNLSIISEKEAKRIRDEYSESYTDQKIKGENND